MDKTLRSRESAEVGAVKVPEVTVLFWVIKVLTTGMGEAASDWLGGINVALAGGVGILGFCFALRLQLRSPRYQPVTYWFAVAMVAVFGTMGADGLHVGLDVPYAASSAFYAVVVGILFWQWRRSEGTLDMHSIRTRRRENYYWATVFATFALGTALGDFTANSLKLGFFASGLLFAGVIALPLLGWWRLRLNEVVAFWAAYVVTRPLGASFADWIGKPPSLTGLGAGDGTVVLISSLAIAGLVSYLVNARRQDTDEVVAARILA